MEMHAGGWHELPYVIMHALCNVMQCLPRWSREFCASQYKHKMAALEKVGAINHISPRVSLAARHTHLIFRLQDGGAAEILSIYEQMSSLDGKHQVYD